MRHFIISRLLDHDEAPAVDPPRGFHLSFELLLFADEKADAGGSALFVPSWKFRSNFCDCQQEHNLYVVAVRNMITSYLCPHNLSPLFRMCTWCIYASTVLHTYITCIMQYLYSIISFSLSPLFHFIYIYTTINKDANAC